MTKTVVTSAKCHCELDVWVDGSVLKGTIHAGVNQFRTHFTIESPEPPDRIQALIRLAKRGCYAEQLVRTAIPLASTYSVNGVEMAMDLGEEAAP
jgi:hypothetical protein